MTAVPASFGNTIWSVPLDRLVEDENAGKGKVVLVTGGASGYGRGLVETMAKLGARVFIVDRNEQALAIVSGNVSKLGGSVGYLAADVTNKGDVEAAFDACRAQFGVPDVVYANAGVASDERLEEEDFAADPQVWSDPTVEVNVAGTFTTATVAQAVWKANPATSNRRLVITASVAGFSGVPGAALYSISKHSCIALWKVITDELASGKLSGFECHAVAPFFSATPMVRKLVYALLAGLPLTPFTGVVGAMVYAGTAPVLTRVDAKHGCAFVMPDAGDACIIPSSEYGFLSQKMEESLVERIASETAWQSMPSWRRITSDIVTNILGIGQSASAKAAVAI